MLTPVSTIASFSIDFLGRSRTHKRKLLPSRVTSLDTIRASSISGSTHPALPSSGVNDAKIASSGENRFRWLEVLPNHCSQQQQEAISRLPSRMTKRSKALMRQLICFSSNKGSLLDLLNAWVRIMKPKRNDWLFVLKELNQQKNPLFSEVAEIALFTESFETNVRDFTKLIHHYGKEGQVQDAERVLSAMKQHGFVCDQVTLTTMIHIYSKAGNLEKAEETFEELRLLGELLDRRSYGSMIMAYVNGGMAEKAEAIISEMETKQIRAGTEVYKALLRSYSMAGNCDGAQRVFNAIQFAGVPPDERICALLINAYQMAGHGDKALIVFENMRKSNISPNDKCVSLILSGYEKENKLNEALNMLIVLEKEGHIIGKEASHILARWIGRLGLAEEVELVLRQHTTNDNLV